MANEAKCLCGERLVNCCDNSFHAIKVVLCNTLFKIFGEACSVGDATAQSNQLEDSLLIAPIYVTPGI